MPAMPRINSKATKIAWAIIGKPVAMNVKKNSAQAKISKRLDFEAVTRVR